MISFLSLQVLVQNAVELWFLWARERGEIDHEQGIQNWLRARMFFFFIIFNM